MSGDCFPTIDHMAARTGGFGGNDWLVEEMYERYLDAPGTLSEAWRSFFEGDGQLPGPGAAPAVDPVAAPPAVATEATARTTPPGGGVLETATTEPPSGPPAAGTASAAPALPEGAEILRGAAATIADRMEASRELPTATSVRSFPAKLLEVNRRIINNQLHRLAEGGKVSFTHLIGWAVVRALADQPEMNVAYTEVDGQAGAGSLPAHQPGAGHGPAPERRWADPAGAQPQAGRRDSTSVATGTPTRKWCAGSGRAR